MESDIKYDKKKQERKKGLPGIYIHGVEGHKAGTVLLSLKTDS